MGDLGLRSMEFVLSLSLQTDLFEGSLIELEHVSPVTLTTLEVSGSSHGWLTCLKNKLFADKNVHNKLPNKFEKNRQKQ